MKHFYLLIFLLAFTFSYGQDSRPGSEIEGFKLYPNPATEGKVYIETGSNSPKKILIFDVLGSPVLETTIMGRELDLSDLDAGVYVLRVFQTDRTITRKLVVK